MEKIDLDKQEAGLVAELARDGLAPIPEIARKLGVSQPTVRSRLKKLIKAGALRVAGLFDPFRVRGHTIALVCLCVASHEMLDEKLRQISALDKVHWAAIVTGRYDIIAEVVLTEDVADLSRFMDKDLSRIGGIRSSETFVVMKGMGKWVLAPEGVREKLRGGA